jgi:hypothetical protein
MLLHELPRKTIRLVQKSITWTDIPVRQPSIVLHGLMKGLARRTLWLPSRDILLLRVNALALFISGYVRRLMPTTKSAARPLMTKPLTLTPSRNGMEHRSGERIEVELPVMVSADQKRAIRGRMQNLSLSGALLRIDADLRLHSLVEVCVELPTPSGHAARLLAHVSRKSKKDVGIEWAEFSPIVVKDLLRSSAMWLS